MTETTPKTPKKSGGPIIKTRFFEIIPTGTKIDFMKMAPYMIGFTVMLGIASLIIIFLHGFNWGIDFAGGLEMRIEMKNAAKNVSISEVRDTMSKLPADLPLSGVQVNSFLMADKNVFSIKAKGEENVTRAGGDTALNDLSAKLMKFLTAKYGDNNVSIVSVDMVGPRVGASLRQQGLYAIIYAMIGIVIYVGFRFNFRYSPGALLCLFHDVVIVAGLYALLNLEIDLTVVAALLTIAGYDINDTIVVFDRIREARSGKYRNLTIRETVNRAINETLSRTTLTSATTLFVVFALLFLGGQILFNFALALAVGIVLGTYSSIFIAAPTYVLLEEFYVNRRKAKGAKA